MGEIIQFGRLQEAPPPPPKRRMSVGGREFELPSTGAEYLSVAKECLGEDQYIAVLCGIMDVEYYMKLPSSLKKIVDSYYSFID